MASEIFGRYEWHLMVDGGDVSIGPGCHGHNLETLIAAAPKEAEVIVKDPGEAEDSNSGAQKLVLHGFVLVLLSFLGYLELSEQV